MEKCVISICTYHMMMRTAKGYTSHFCLSSHPIACDKSVHAWRAYISYFHHPTTWYNVWNEWILYYGRNNGRGIIWLTRHQSVECLRKEYASRVIDCIYSIQKREEKKEENFSHSFPIQLHLLYLWLMHNMLFLYFYIEINSYSVAVRELCGVTGREEHKNHELRWNLLWESISGRLTKGF